MFHPPLPASSLRRKILLGYLAVGGLILGLSLAAFLELHQWENRLEAGGRIAGFLNAILEMRRYEKNFFLYRQEEDIENFRLWLAEAGGMLRGHAPEFAALLPPGIALEERLRQYGRTMDDYIRAPGASPGKENVRRLGKELATTAETMAKEEKQRLFTTLAHHRQALLGAIAALACMLAMAGRILIRGVTAPLKRMEETMGQVAQGQLTRIDLPSRDREILSLATAFNHMLRELQARRKQMVRSEKLASLGTMLSGVAHELNNPLSNIATSCQILLEEQDVTGFHRELLEQIDSQTLRARDIVRSLLHFARDRPFLREAVAVAPLVEETVRLLRGQTPPGVAVERRVEESLTVMADRQRLQQALLNLVKNGVDALTGQGHILIRARALERAPDVEEASPLRLVAGHASRCAVGPVVEILVEDDGPGMDPALLPRILDPFFTTKETGQGFGLGLFVTHEIVEEHGGCLVVDSRPGKGSSFCLILPRESPLEKTA